MYVRILTAAALSIVLAASGSPDPSALIIRMDAAYGTVQDYTAVFIKQERVDGELLPEETVQFKFKMPFKVYMKWLPGPHEGREAMYVQGAYGDKVVGHEGGLLGIITLHMDPSGSIAMRGNRHPITDAGIGRLVAIVMDNYLRAAKTGEATVAYRGEEAVYGRTTYHVGVALPPQKEKGYYAKDMDIWVDKELGLPIKIMIYGWQGELVESYGYRDLRLNPGLKDSEFDPDFKSYGF